MSEIKNLTNQMLPSQMRALVFLGYSCLLVLGTLDNLRGPFYSGILQDLSLNFSWGSLFFVVPASLSAMGSLWASRFLMRRGLLALVRLGFIILALGFLAISIALNWWQLVLACILFGFGTGLISVAQNMSVKLGAEPQWRRQLFNGLHSVYAAASLIAPLLANWFLNLGLDWRQSFQWTTLLCLTVFVFSFFVGAEPMVAAKADDSAMNLPTHLKKQSGTFATIMGFYLWLELGLSTRLVLYCQTELQWSLADANWLLAAFFVMLLLGRMTFAIWAFEFKNIDLLQASLFGALVFSVLGLTVTPWLFLGSSFCMAPFFPVLIDEMSERAGEHAPQCIARIVGWGSAYMVLAHLMMGFVSDYLSTTWALWALLPAVVVSWLLLGNFKQLSRRQHVISSKP